MEPQEIFEDNYILVLDKPSSWVVNRAESVKGKTVQDWVEERPEWELTNTEALKGAEGTENFVKRSGLVHRLDKETSGVLVVAKTSKAFKNLQAQFKKRKVEKIYTALVHGKVEPEKGSVEVSVGRLPWNRERFGVLPGGRKAKTRYHAISNFQFPISNEKFSLLEICPKTGRTHQIRVHMKYLGHPIVSDEFYAGRKTARDDRTWCPRLFLHASEISFSHPKTGEKVSFQSELPKILQSSLKKLKK